MMMTTRRLCCGLACAALLATSACGGGSDYPTKTNPQAAAAAVMQLAGIGAGVQGSSSDSAANGVLALGSAAQNIIQPVTNQPGGQPMPTALITDPGQIHTLTGTCSCDATGCVFKSCSDAQAGFTIDGTISVSGQSYSFDVSVTQSYSNSTTSTKTNMSTSGDITITATSIDGSISGNGDTSDVITGSNGQQTIKGSWNWTMDANQIALDQNRCAVGGALHTCLSAHASSSTQSAQYNGCGTVDFGPTCGDATAE